MRRHVDAVIAEEMQAIRLKQEAAAKERHNRRLVRALAARAKARKERIKKEEKELKAKLDALPITFSESSVGAAGKRGEKARADCLERLKQGSPKLPLDLEKKWPQIRDEFANYVPKYYEFLGKDRIGESFITRISHVLRELGPYFSSAVSSSDASKKGGKPNAFRDFCIEMERRLPSSKKVSVTM